MPGERDLARDDPDPVAVIGAVLRRFLHEASLGQARLTREEQHDIVRDVISVVDDRNRVSLERNVREDVEDGVGKLSFH